MKQSLDLLLTGFESSSGKTPEWLTFFKTFKREFTKELQSIGAQNIVFNRGHFYLSGFFTVNGLIYYFSLSDVRGMDYGLRNNPDSCMSQLLFRRAAHYKDFTGGQNHYVRIGTGMAEQMYMNNIF